MKETAHRAIRTCPRADYPMTDVQSFYGVGNKEETEEKEKR